LIISGAALIYAMKDEIAKKVMDIADQCKAVLACRVSPKQKQEIVTLVRTEVLLLHFATPSIKPYFT
jgi:phospholipid-transporting ATPase